MKYFYNNNSFLNCRSWSWTISYQCIINQSKRSRGYFWRKRPSI